MYSCVSKLEKKARADLGGLISLFVKQLKRVDMTSAEAAVRLAKLESLPSKIVGLEQRLSSPGDHASHRPTENFTNHHVEIGHTAQNPGDDAGLIETNDGSAESRPTLIEEPANDTGVDMPSLSGTSSAIGANGPG